MATSMPGAALRFSCAAEKKLLADAAALDAAFGGAPAARERAAMPAKLRGDTIAYTEGYTLVNSKHQTW